MMATAQVVETSVTNCLFQDNLNPEDQPSLDVSAPGFKPFHALRSLGRQTESLSRSFINGKVNIKRIYQQLWFNHRCLDFNLTPPGLGIKSPIHTKEAYQIIQTTTRRLIHARINDCHRRILRLQRRTELSLNSLKPRLPTDLLNIVLSIAD